jgi:POT family proton-dependent oligopeptide transporter
MKRLHLAASSVSAGQGQIMASPGNNAAQTTGIDFPQRLGHPAPLWMLFMTEFWERFSFYGMRWALTLYIVAQFYGGSGTGEAPAGRIYGAYLALVYASGLLGGYAADRLIGYQRSILLGAVIMGSGLFVMMIPSMDVFELGLTLVIVGNGLFKPNISTMVGQLYAQNDFRRDAGFTIFYMGINAGSFISPLLTGWLASVITDTPMQQNYKVVFASAGVGMILSFPVVLVRAAPVERHRRAAGECVGHPQHGHRAGRRGDPGTDCVRAAGQARRRRAGLGARRIVRRSFDHAADRRRARRSGAARQGHRDADHLRVQHPVLDVLRASRFVIQLPCEKIVNRTFGDWVFPVAWFQSVNPIGVIAAGAARCDGMGCARQAQSRAFDPAQVRARPDRQRHRVPAADVCVDPAGRRPEQDSVLDPVHGLHHPGARRTVPVADRTFDGDQARAEPPRRLRHGRDGS